MEKIKSNIIIMRKIKAIKEKSKQAEKSYFSHLKKCSDLEAMLDKYLDFDFSVDYRADDGLIICHNKSSCLASFKTVLDKIEKGENITLIDFAL
jgi:hypothetical protein